MSVCAFSNLHVFRDLQEEKVTSGVKTMSDSPRCWKVTSLLEHCPFYHLVFPDVQTQHYSAIIFFALFLCSSLPNFFVGPSLSLPQQAPNALFFHLVSSNTHLPLTSEVATQNVRNVVFHFSKSLVQHLCRATVHH